MRRSVVLDELGCSYSIESVPADGNCFYHAFIKSNQLGITVKKLRRFIARKVTDDDVVIFGAVHNTPIEKKQVRNVICNTNQWADELEITILMRNLPQVALFIVDEDNTCVCKKGNDSAKHNSILCLKDQHYYAIFAKDDKLITAMSGIEYLFVNLDKSVMKTEIDGATDQAIDQKMPEQATDQTTEQATDHTAEQATEQATAQATDGAREMVCQPPRAATIGTVRHATMSATHLSVSFVIVALAFLFYKLAFA